jgi:propane monooxygenase reductase subunit
MFTITIEPAGRQFPCNADETILDAAFREGLRLPHGCRTGGCGACKARIIGGEFDDSRASLSAMMDFERDAGNTLLCSCFPLSDVSVWVEQLEEDVAPPRYLDACVAKQTEPAAGLVGIELALETNFAFMPGQYIEINVPRTEHWRAYSLANRVGDPLEILVKLFPGGLFSEYLRAGRLKPGSLLSIRGPYGSFALHPGDVPILFVAGGSGLAPVLAMLRAMAMDANHRSIRLLYGARTQRDLCFVDELRGYEKSFPDMRFIPVLSEAGDDREWRGATGMVTEVIEKCVEGQTHQAYLSGPPAMIDAALPILRHAGIPESETFFDKFLTRADLAKR